MVLFGLVPFKFFHGENPIPAKKDSKSALQTLKQSKIFVQNLKQKHQIDLSDVL